MEIQIKSENEDFYFCQITDEKSFTFDCSFRKLSNFLKSDLYDRKCILESCSKLDAENHVVFEMYGFINIHFSPSLYSYISVKKSGNERVIWFGYKYGDFYTGTHEFIKSDAIIHKKYGYYDAIGNRDEEDLAKDKDLCVNKYFTRVPQFRYGTGNLPIQIELDSDCPSNEEVLEVISISKLGNKVAELFEEQKHSLALKSNINCCLN